MMDRSNTSSSTPAVISIVSDVTPQSSNTSSGGASSSPWQCAEFIVGEHYHARAYTDQVWDLAKLLRIISVVGSTQHACVQWSLSGLEQIIPITADTLRAVPRKRERKCVHDFADEENALRSAIGMRKVHASSQKKMKKEPIVRRPVEDGRRKTSSITIELIRSAEVKSIQCLSIHAEELKPFVTKKTYRSLQSALAASSPCERDRPPLSGPCERQVPKAVVATLRKYQVEGLSWLVDRYDSGINCVLADEMGLGKTLQTIAFLAYLQEVPRDAGPHLVVVPMSVMFNWVAECRKFCPSLRLLRLHSTNPAECSRLRDQLQDTAAYDVAITTYEMIKGGLETAFHRMIWRSVVLDEGHRIKNPETFLSKACMKLRSRFKLILTGTPVQNNLCETFSLLHFLNPHVFQADCAPLFGACFSLTAASAPAAAVADRGGEDNSSSIPSAAPPADADRSESTINHINQPTIDRSLLDAAHYMMRPFILRRIKTEVEHSLPPKLETLIRCPLSKVQRMMIRGLLLRDGALIDQHLGGSGGSSSDVKSSTTDWKHLQSLVAQLRKASNHPYLFTGVESSAAGPAQEDVVTSSGKMVVLDRLLQRLKLRGHRVVLFSQYTRTLDIIGDYLDLRGYSHCRLDGSTNRVMREVLINQFNKKDSPVFVFCLSTRAGGEGVNLFTADTVVLFDSDWNPQVDIQAMARVHRIGQTRPVHVYRLVSRGTVEERIVQRAQKKLFLDCMVNRGSTAQGLEIDRKLLEAKQLMEAKQYNARGRDKYQQIDDATDGDVDISTIMSALKFGWNACFGADNDVHDEDADQCAASYLSDETVDAIIDRTRLSNSSLSGELTDEGGEGGGMASSSARQLVGLQEGQEQSASGFEEAAPLVSIRSFEGEHFSRERKEVTMSDVSSQWIIDKLPGQGGQRRERESRLEQVHVKDVGLVSVLKLNNYSLEQGEPSVFEKEGKKFRRDPTGSGSGGKKRPRCFENQDHCQRCWNYGTLVCCNYCPASYHPACDGMKKVPSFIWSCPHHRGCVTCQRPSSSTGFLFRCEMCPDAFCEDCLPLDHAFVGRSCDRWEELGFVAPSNACFIHCGADCVAFAAKQRIESNGSAN